jgi:CheY-like chemotaxis protein
MQNSGMENGQTLSVPNSQVKILVVDDHPNTANMLARAISRLGPHVQVTSAINGQEALSHAKNTAVDILITDMMMPEMTGLKLIETLKAQQTGHSLITFLVTAHDSTGLREIANQLNVKEVLAKPVHPERICQIVTQAMDEINQLKTAAVALPLLVEADALSNSNEIKPANQVEEIRSSQIERK